VSKRVPISPKTLEVGKGTELRRQMINQDASGKKWLLKHQQPWYGAVTLLTASEEACNNNYGCQEFRCRTKTYTSLI